MKSLVIAEKPSVARDIARVLGANQKNGGILEGKNYVVTWALGHLVTLADPEEYDRKYEKWEMATLPMLPKEMKLVVIRQTGRQFSVVKTQLFRKDIGEIIRKLCEQKSVEIIEAEACKDHIRFLVSIPTYL